MMIVFKCPSIVSLLIIVLMINSGQPVSLNGHIKVESVSKTFVPQRPISSVPTSHVETPGTEFTYFGHYHKQTQCSRAWCFFGEIGCGDGEDGCECEGGFIGACVPENEIR